MNTTYTHTGRRAAVGYQHTGRDFNHYEKTRGRRHALNVKPHVGYEAVCGVVVAEYSNDCHDQGGKNPVELATANPLVTCKACLRRKPVAAAVPKKVKWVVMLETTTDATPVRWSDERTQEVAESYAANLRQHGRPGPYHPEGWVKRAWVERIEE